MLLAGLVALTLLAVVALTRPWWRPRYAGGPARRAANVAAYRGRLAEIERDRAAGLIPEDASEQLQREAAAQLLGDTEGVTDDDRMAATGASVRWVGIGLVLVVPLFAGLWYWQAGGWRTQAQASTAAAEVSAAASPEVQAMVERLADKLRSNPDDANGWAMLGRSYFVMHRYMQAAGAYREANARNGGKDAGTLAGEGEALAFANGQDVPPDAAALFDRALVLEPDNGPALWYGGIADAQASNWARARQRWVRLRQQPLPDAMKDMVDRALAQLAVASGGAEPAAPGAVSEAASAPANSAAAAQAPVSLSLNVRIAPELAAKVPSGALLFVFAKADGGPPMPLAVSRRPVGTWPVSLTLDDSMAMAPGMRLSNFERYVVTARISVSGQAQAQPGDLEGTLRIARAQAGQPAEIVIDRAVP
jgi:cytochrome c-type biogenesis protein CcmH